MALQGQIHGCRASVLPAPASNPGGGFLGTSPKRRSPKAGEPGAGVRGRALVAHSRLGPLRSPAAEQGTRGPLKPDPFLSSSFLLWVDDTPGSSGFAADLPPRRLASPLWAECLTQGALIFSPSPKYVN